jgi:hypothetical protein
MDMASLNVVADAVFPDYSQPEEVGAQAGGQDSSLRRLVPAVP